MKGRARTVFAGSEPQEFGVEIIGVLPGFTGPRMSTIIARLSGANVDKTSVFAGMSGSPVFMPLRLVWALSYIVSVNRLTTSPLLVGSGRDGAAGLVESVCR